MGGKDSFLPEWPQSKSQHKFCSCVLKRDLLECVPAEHEERDHTALISAHHSPAARQYQDANSQWKQRELSIYRNISALFSDVCCSSEMRRLSLWFVLTIWCKFIFNLNLMFHRFYYGIKKHFNIQHCHVFIRPYKYCLLSQNYKFKTSSLQFFFKKNNKKKQCFKTKKNYNNTVIISVYIVYSIFICYC